MVLYFSGTGNSQHVAIRLAKQIADDEIVSINACLRMGKGVSTSSKRPLVFVAPTYSWRMPRVVEQWIQKTAFAGGQAAYFVLTCAGGCGNAALYAKELCAKKGLWFRGLAPVLMPENYLALFPTPGEPESRTILENAGPVIAALSKKILAGEDLPEPSVSLVEKLQSGLVNSLFYPLFVRDKGFTAANTCISCGKCASRCPLNNIELVHGRPVWKGSCTHCMACIGGCPCEAIEYQSKSKGRRRHYIMEDSLCVEHTGEEE